MRNDLALTGVQTEAHFAPYYYYYRSASPLPAARVSRKSPRGSVRVRSGPVVDFSLNRTARCVVCLSVGSSLDQYYSTSTPNFAVGRDSGRRRAAAEPGGAWTRWRRTGDAGSEPVSAATVSPAPDLATRNDTLQSPRVSPLLWFQQCRSLVPGARVACWSCR